MRHPICAAVLLALATASPVPALAANEISTDITVDLGGTVAADEDVIEDAGGTATQIDVGTLPAAADVIGYSVKPGGKVVFSIDISAELPGGVDVTPRDVVRWNGSIYSIEYAGGASLPAGAKIDAIGYFQGDLILSLDISATLGGVAADDEDLVRLTDTSPDTWALFFDGSAEGVPAGADLDGADVLDASGNLALSFDISGSIGGVSFDDEDILEFAESGGAWSKRYDGSTAFAALAAADVDAVFAPEAGALAAALTAFAALGARRLRARSGLYRADESR